MKKIAIAMAALMAAMPAVAHAESDSPLQGASAGIALTHDSNKIDMPGSDFSAEKNGLGVVGFVGYDAVLGDRFLIGAQAELGTGGKTAGGEFGSGLAAYFVDPGITYGASARAGVLASPNLAIYGRVGIRMLQGTIAVVDVLGNLAADKTTETGFAYGVGAEYALGSAFSVRAEFNRTNFDRGISQNKLLVGGAVRF